MNESRNRIPKVWLEQLALGLLVFVSLETLRALSFDRSVRLRELSIPQLFRDIGKGFGEEWLSLLPTMMHRTLNLGELQHLLVWIAFSAMVFLVGVLLLTPLIALLTRLLGRSGDLEPVVGTVVSAVLLVPVLVLWNETFRYRLVGLGAPKWFSWPVEVLVLAGAWMVGTLVLYRIRETALEPVWKGVSIGFLLFAMVGLLGASRPATHSARANAPVGAPNVLLISIDSLRADHLGSYGYPKPTSPRIDQLASEGVLFERAYAPTSWTLPSHLTMMTGRQPKELGIGGPRQSLAPSTPVLAEILRDHGYRTAGIVSGAYLDASYGFSRGFDLYDDYSVVKSHELSSSGETSTEAVELALKWLERWTSEAPDSSGSRSPFFLFLHLWDVHYDYTPPSPYDSMFDPDYDGSLDFRNVVRNAAINSEMDERDLEHLIALYDGEIRYTDQWIGRLLAHLELLEVVDETLVVLTSDHGEEFFEHGSKEHSTALYTESVHVPLIFRWPGRLPSGSRRSDVVQLADIAPTILGLALGKGELLSGQGLCGGEDLSREQGENELKELALGSLELNDQLSIRSSDYSFLTRHADTRERLEELFAVTSDPSETVDLSPELVEVVDEMRSIEAAWRACWSGSREERELSPEIEENLRSFGYIN